MGGERILLQLRLTIGLVYIMYLTGVISDVILRSETTKNLAHWKGNEILRYAQDDSNRVTFDTKSN
jgi:hypothetical protein